MLGMACIPRKACPEQGREGGEGCFRSWRECCNVCGRRKKSLNAACIWNWENDSFSPPTLPMSAEQIVPFFGEMRRKSNTHCLRFPLHEGTKESRASSGCTTRNGHGTRRKVCRFLTRRCRSEVQNFRMSHTESQCLLVWNLSFRSHIFQKR